MEDSEIQDFVHRHMGRLDEPMRTYAAELAKAVNDAAIEEGRQQMINELKFDLDLLKHHNEKMGPEIEKLKRRHASISRHTAMLSKVLELDGLFRGLKA